MQISLFKTVNRLCSFSFVCLWIQSVSPRFLTLQCDITGYIAVQIFNEFYVQLSRLCASTNQRWLAKKSYCRTEAWDPEYILPQILKRVTAVAQWLRCCATNRNIAGSIPAGVSGFLIDIKSFRSHYAPGVDSASNRNEYQEYFLGVKSGRCVRLTTLPPSWASVTQSGNLNLLEPSGHLGPVMGLL